VGGHDISCLPFLGHLECVEHRRRRTSTSLCTKMPVHFLFFPSRRTFRHQDLHDGACKYRGIIARFLTDTDLSPGKGGAFNRSMQHHLGTNLFKGGVYDRTKTVETYSRGKDRHLAPMEVRAVPARDWARSWPATSHHAQVVVANWRHSSRPSSPLTVGTHPSGARRHLTRNCL